jgi:hypothetical protein
MKTMDEYRIEFTELFLESAQEFAIKLGECQSEILLAFCAKYGMQPDEAVLLYQGNKFWVEKKYENKN